MNEREISELKRRFRADRANITAIRGCYFNDKGEKLSQFTQSISLMLDDEKEKLLGVLKKVLSGTCGKNLTDLSFPTKEVTEGPSHALLTKLRNSKLQDDAAAEEFFDKVAKTVHFETNFLVLLAHDAYDVPYKGKDGSLQDDASDQVFSYIVCCVCPVKLSKSGLSYHSAEGAFHNARTDWIVSAPEVGFTFPAFDNRASNIYGSLLYRRSASEEHAEFVSAVFGQEAPMTATAQQENFQTMLGTTLDTDCSLEVVQTVHAQFSDMIKEHKESRDRDALLVSKPEVNHMLKSCGVAEERIAAFDRQFDEAFGQYAELRPQNLIDSKKFRLSTPQVSIQVDPEHRDLIETRVMGGAKYILIRAEEGVEVNGVQIHIE